MLKLKKKERAFDREKEYYIGDEFINPMEVVEAMENSDFLFLQFEHIFLLHKPCNLNDNSAFF